MATKRKSADVEEEVLYKSKDEKEEMKKLEKTVLEALLKKRDDVLRQKIAGNERDIEFYSSRANDYNYDAKRYKSFRRKGILLSTSMAVLGCAAVGFIPTAIVKAVEATKERDQVVSSYQQSDEFARVRDFYIAELDNRYNNGIISSEKYEENTTYYNSYKFAVEQIENSSFSYEYQTADTTSGLWTLLGGVLGGAACIVGGVFAGCTCVYAAKDSIHELEQIEYYNGKAKEYEDKVKTLEMCNTMYRSELSK